MSKSLVSKATVDDAKEPTGFALKELASHSFTSLQAASELADLLLRRVEKDSPDVKFKALKCIKYLCLHGRAEFRSDAQRESAVIKQALRRNNKARGTRTAESIDGRIGGLLLTLWLRACSSLCVLSLCPDFKGPADPLRGDAPNQRVRDEAKECLNAVFNGPATRPLGAGLGSRLEGYGGGGEQSAGGALGSPTSEMSGGGARNSYGGGYGEGTFSSAQSGGSGSGSASGSKMVGFGNPSFDNSPAAPSFIDKMKNKMGGGGAAQGQTGPYKHYDRPGGYANPSTFTPPPIAALDSANGGRKRGEVGGVWASEDASHSRAGGGSFVSHGQGGPSSSPSAYHGAAHVPAPVRPTSSNGEYELRLIESLTPAAGVRSVPSKEELGKFATQCESLDKLLVVRLINETKLTSSTPPAAQMKALCLLECILTTGDAAATEEVEDYLCDHAAQNLEAIEAQGPTPPLRNKAVRVMELCGLREEKRSAAAAPTAAAAPSAAAAGVATNFYAQQTQQPAKSAEVDLLGFMQPAPAAVAASPASSNSAFGFLEAGDAPASANGNGSANGGGDMFGSLEVKAAPAQQGGATDPFDLFGGATQSSPPAAAATATGSNSFEFLNSSPPAAANSVSSSKVDPLTALMSNARVSAHPQPRAPMQQQQQGPPMMGGAPFGANGGMAGFAPRGPPMPPLGPQYPQQQQQQQAYGQPAFPQGYPAQQGFPQQQHGFPQQRGYPQQQQAGLGFGGPSPQQLAANQNMLFSVKAAGSNPGGLGAGGGAGPLASHMRPTIELDPLGNPIVLGGPSGGPSAGSGPAASSSAFGFVAAGGDSFGFVNDMLAGSK